MEFFWSFLNTFLLMYAMFWVWDLLTKSDELNEDRIREVAEQIDQAIVFCTVEQVGDTFYLYEADTENFIGQGKNTKDFEDISERLQKHVMIVDGDESAVAQLKELTSETSSNK